MLQNEHATNFFLYVGATTWQFEQKFRKLMFILAFGAALPKFQCYMWYVWHSACARIHDFFCVRMQQKNIAFDLMEDMLFFCHSFILYMCLWVGYCSVLNLYHFEILLWNLEEQKMQFVSQFHGKCCDFFSMSNIALISGTFFNFKSQSLRIFSNFPRTSASAIYLPVRISFISNQMIFFSKSIFSANFNHHWIWFICRTNHWM